MILPKPPKLFRTRPTVEASPEPTMVQPAAQSEVTESERVWSPSTPPPETEQAVETPAVAAPAEVEPVSETPVEDKAIAKEPVAEAVTETVDEVPPVSASEPMTEEQTIEDEEKTVSKSGDDFSRYAPPTAVKAEPEKAEEVPEPEPEPIETETAEEAEIIANESRMVRDDTHDFNIGDSIETSEDLVYSQLGADQPIVRVKSLNSVPFADIWFTAEKIAYIRDTKTSCALIPFVSDDLEDFYKALEQGYTGHSSFSIRFAGEAYRVERILTVTGVQYNCRKMPGQVPDIDTLGLPKYIVDYLLTLSKESGLILFGGPTGMGKTTSASALMKRYLETDGGFMYTVEDPPEMPLDGLYRAKNGGLGLCKQCPVVHEQWGEGIKSSLRSRPRYILVGEIRTPETASQVLRAATSGHLVLSTIHASTVEDALESLIKYASGAGLTESLAADLLSRGILAVVHQKLEGAEALHPVLTCAFANPHLTGGDQMRSLIRNNTINLQTLIEAQSSRLMQGRPLFNDV